MIQFLFCDTTEVVQAGHERRYQKDKDAQHKSNQGPLHFIYETRYRGNSKRVAPFIIKLLMPYVATIVLFQQQQRRRLSK
jgi:hypothetical protein